MAGISNVTYCYIEFILFLNRKNQYWFFKRKHAKVIKVKTDIFQLVMRIYKRNKNKSVFALTNEGYKALTAYVEDTSPYFE